MAVPIDSIVMKRLVPVAVPLAVPMVNMKAGRLWLVLVAVPLLVVVVAPMKSGVWMAPMGPVAPVGNMAADFARPSSIPFGGLRDGPSNCCQTSERGHGLIRLF